MNTFHEINMMTSRGDSHAALSLICGRSENVARKIMKKAGYSVPEHKGRAFWMWVQKTLLAASRARRNGYQAHAERKALYRTYREQAHDDYAAWTKMMSQSGHEKDARFTVNTPPESVVAEPEINMTPSVSGGVPTSGLIKMIFAGGMSQDSGREGRRRIQVCPAAGARHHQPDRTGGRRAGRAAHRHGVHALAVPCQADAVSCNHPLQTPCINRVRNNDSHVVGAISVLAVAVMTAWADADLRDTYTKQSPRMLFYVN